MKKQKSQNNQQHELEASEKEQQKFAALRKEADILLKQDARRDQARRTRPHIFLIVLVMTGALTLTVLDRYYKHHNNHRFLIILSAILMTGGSGYLVYCLKSKRAYLGNLAPVSNPWGRGEWVYRDENPFIYWFYMALISFYEAVAIYVFFRLLIKGSV